MFFIIELDTMLIIEHKSCRTEIHAMFNEISAFFLLVPFKLHTISLKK